MRDLDELQRYEASQQHLIEGIIEGMHRTTEDDYLVRFRTVAVDLLGFLHEPTLTPNERLTHTAVILIDTFLREREGYHARVDVGAERRYLIYRLLEKVLQSIAANIYGTYQQSCMDASR